MEFFLELLLEVFGEALLQFIFEALAEVGLHLFHQAPEREPVRPWLAAVGYMLLGAACGGLSHWLFPSFFLQSSTGRAASFVITPVLAGVGMALIGAWRRRRGEQVIRLDRFAYGYAFALAMAAVRFHFGRVG